MKKRLTILSLVLLIASLSLTACGLLQAPEEASGPIEAIPLATEEAGVATAEPQQVAPTAAPTEASIEAVEPVVAATAAPTEAPAEQPTVAPAVTQVYTLDQTASQVRFQLDEDLRGQRTTVVGTTDQVAGEIAVNLADLSQTQVGVIQINARTLLTDNNFRNRAIQNEILDTGQYEFITFTPAGVMGLPASAAVGDTVSFTIDGDLTIRDVTLPASFAVEAMVVSETQITGTATAVVNRADYGLQIPSVPNVANVEEEVELYIDFTANASQ